MTRLFALAVAVGLGCGRIPGLLDAGARAPGGDAPPASGQADLRRDDGRADAAAGGRRVADGAGGSGGTRPDAATDRTGGRGGQGGLGALAGCGGVITSMAMRQPADVLLVLDRSGSMNFNIARECSCDPQANPKVVCADTEDCETRWAGLSAALDSTMSSTPFLHWGLKLFSSPTAGPCEVTAGVEVPIGPDATTAIHDRITALTPAGETPTAAAILTATNYLATQSDANSKVLLLATDGKPNCGGTVPSVYNEDVSGTLDAITAAVDDGFLVYVVGIGTGVSLDNLNSFARAGGTGQYYPAQSADDLTRALASISKAATCTFALPDPAPDANDVAVYLDHNQVPQDTSNGWSFGANAQTVLLHGRACEQALANAVSTLQVLFSCGGPLPTLLP